MFFSQTGYCPICQQKGKSVERVTLLSHVNDISMIHEGDYYFCSTAECEIVYHGASIFKISDINKEVGMKNVSSPHANLCYCFNHTKTDIDTDTLPQIEKQMQQYGCQCIIRNVSGHCCLTEIKHYLKGKE